MSPHNQIYHSNKNFHFDVRYDDPIHLQYWFFHNEENHENINQNDTQEDKQEEKKLHILVRVEQSFFVIFLLLYLLLNLYLNLIKMHNPIITISDLHISFKNNEILKNIIYKPIFFCST